MYEAVITSIEGYVLRLSHPHPPTGPHEPWSFTVELDNGHGRAWTGVWNLGETLAGFFSSLARDWRGWDGERAFVSLEGQLEVHARHDGVGQFTCGSALGTCGDPAWRFETEMTIGAGAHAETIAADIAALVSAAQ